MGYMEVVVPPDIMDDKWSGSGSGSRSELAFGAAAGGAAGGSGSEQVANEGGSVKLRCVATGVPEPNVTWRREGNWPIVLRAGAGGGSGNRAHTQRVEKLDGEYLELNNVTREDMGSYFCIASNGIPPTVSKRYSVLVNCSYPLSIISSLFLLFFFSSFRSLGDQATHRSTTILSKPPLPRRRARKV